MNYTRLVEMIKEIGRNNLQEARNRHHSARYARPLGDPSRYDPKDTPQLAEDDEEDKQNNNGKTLTGSKADLITINPERISNLSAGRGMPKPSVDNK